MEIALRLQSPPATVLSEHRPWRDARATVRYRCAPAAAGRVLIPDEDGDREYQRAWLMDLSQSGVGFSLVRPISVGTTIQIRVQNPATQQSIALEAVVAHCTLQPSGGWFIGCRFVKEISKNDLHDLLD